MPLLVQTARKWFKADDIWLKSWKKASQNPNFEMADHLRRLIKYYPKNLKAFKLLTPEIEGNPLEPSQEVLQLKKVLYSKYNKNFIRHLDVPEDSQNIEKLAEVKLVSLSSLRITEHEFTNISKTRIRSIKHVDSLEIRINNYGPPSESLIKCIRKIRPITSLTLHDLQPLPLEEYQRLFRHLKFRLEALTIQGKYFCPAIQNPGQFTELLEFFFNFPRLKVVHIDASDLVPVSSGIDAIPLNILKQKQIKFDIRINQANSDDPASLVSEENIQALSDIQVLGINNQLSFTQPEAVWDCIEEAHLDIQKKIKGNLFYINRIDLSSQVLLSLTETCKNISTLNMILTPTQVAVDFSALSQLSSLQNLFIQFSENDNPPLHLFESLRTIAQAHKKLEFASFEFLGGQIGEDYAVVEPFFEASKDALKKVILKFRNLNADISGIKYFYQGLQKLNQMTSLSLLIRNIFKKDSPASYHSDLLPKILEDLSNLTELNLSLPQSCQENDLLPNLNLSKSIKKLCLDFYGGKTCGSLIKNLPTLVNLQQLDLTIAAMEEGTWKKLYQVFSGLEMLEILRLHNDPPSFTVPIEDLQFFMETKKGMKFIVFKKVFSAFFVLTRKNYYEGDVDGFIALGLHGVPQKTSPTKTFFY